MKTNKILVIGLLAAATVLATGCSDSFLEVENPTGEPLEEYYTTDERIQEALIAAYDPIHWADWGLGQYNALNIDAEIMGDNFWVGGATKTDMQNWHMLFNYEGNENNTLSSLWTVDYSGVKTLQRFVEITWIGLRTLLKKTVRVMKCRLAVCVCSTIICCGTISAMCLSIWRTSTNLPIQLLS